MAGASPGDFGTTLSQAGWLPVLRTLGTNPWFGGRLLVPRAGTVFDAEGTLVSDEVRELLRRFVHGFVGLRSRDPPRRPGRLARSRRAGWTGAPGG